MNTLGRILTDAGIAFFPFNNRGAHIMKSIKVEESKSPKVEGQKSKQIEVRRQESGEELQSDQNPNLQPLTSKVQAGTAYELIADCVHDIDGAVAYLQAQGYTELYLIGTSTGANKICVYHHLVKQSSLSRYILLSGGDDTGLYYEMLGKKGYFAALKKAEEKVKAGKGNELAETYLTGGVISYQSLYDTLNPDGYYNVFPFNEYFNKLGLSKKPLFEEYQSLGIPTLVAYGAEDEFCYGRVGEILDLLKEKASRSELFQFRSIPGADHGFTGYEVEMAEMIRNFLVES
jgi:pimeloyl-ACP methyl ester carboxylesterase